LGIHGNPWESQILLWISRFKVQNGDTLPKLRGLASICLRAQTLQTCTSSRCAGSRKLQDSQSESIDFGTVIGESVEKQFLQHESSCFFSLSFDRFFHTWSQNLRCLAISLARFFPVQDAVMKPNCHVCGKFVGIIIAEAIGFGWIWMDLDHVRSLCQNAARMHQRTDARARVFLALLKKLGDDASRCKRQRLQSDRAVVPTMSSNI